MHALPLSFTRLSRHSLLVPCMHACLRLPTLPSKLERTLAPPASLLSFSVSHSFFFARLHRQAKASLSSSSREGYSSSLLSLSLLPSLTGKSIDCIEHVRVSLRSSLSLSLSLFGKIFHSSLLSSRHLHLLRCPSLPPLSLACLPLLTASRKPLGADCRRFLDSAVDPRRSSMFLFSFDARRGGRHAKEAIAW